MRTKLVLSGLLLVALSGCHHHMPVGRATVNEPGAHVISSAGATSIAWSDGRTSRVCTLPAAAHPGRFSKSKRLPAGHAMPAHGRAGGLDALLFRLCEARGNGDLTAEQYHAALNEFLQVMKHAHTKMGQHMGAEGGQHWRPPGHGKRGSRPGRGPGFGPGGMDGPRPGPAEQPPVQQGTDP